MQVLKNALLTGGLVLVTGPLCMVSQAQDYIDVEAERAASKRQQQPATPPPGTPAPVYSAPAPTAAPAPAQTAPAPVSAVASPVTSTATLGAPTGGNAQSNLLFQVQQLQQEVMRLNGMVEEQGNELRRLKEQSLERYVDLDKRVSAMGAGGAAIATGGAADAMASGGGTGPEQAGEAEAYRAAYALVAGQQFDSALGAFQRFLQDYPGGKYAANAHYWLGELYLVVDPQDLEGSRQSFTLLLSEYPDNAKVPDAQYKLGKVHYMKGNPDRGREFLDQVIREHGNSTAASLARTFIDENY
ncbi:MAG: tol-pal system protein YbgF [Pseudomonadota bacterium]